jgi:hypothetical protein
VDISFAILRIEVLKATVYFAVFPIATDGIKRMFLPDFLLDVKSELSAGIDEL